ncbi:glycosyltransferase family 2 protein [Spiribacter roseus]|uniref:Glycosyltransferase family 2 protein n=1 Tax=Spiribacter roseus TaxID=1855875 RepID=A0ABV3RYN5_9GAMM
MSVYIPTRNRLPLLRRAIQSVKSQTYNNIEIIVVDDGSSDGTADYLSRLSNYGEIKAVFHKKSKGSCLARNEAIMIASGDFITGLDDDDYFVSENRIEKFVNVWLSLEKKPAGLFDSVLVRTKSCIINRHICSVVTYSDLKKSNAIGSQIFAPRSHYVQSGLFDPLMPAWQDWDLWLRISFRYGQFVNINLNSYLVDEQHDSTRITASNSGQIRSAMERLSSKLPGLTQSEKSSLLVSLMAYPQVKPTPRDLMTLLFALRLRSLFSSIRKLAS